MTAYDVAAWSDFAQTVSGGAAALAGLLFVGLSLNLDDILRHPGVPARAAATLSLTISILLVTVFLATPGQPPAVLGAEIGGLGAAMAAGSVWAGRHQGGGRSTTFRVYTLLILLVPSVLLVFAGLSLSLQWGGGLYWMTAGVVAAFLAASANSWVLLVEIKR
ncbi:hypothetical protein AU196_18855 [Mycobacterium sp. IS-1742]|uniref:hypothetical protein n=1 Tax=Mycobacterium sp. IS-1742 TaxID=1772285 RepID=UPI00073FB8DB|nr:hypothetical protein [Mycobacterium sp. IS-1742]KUI31376.1 hypothetical protein AU196_18855 [Mycobacterium sp. IS-1742]